MEGAPRIFFSEETFKNNGDMSRDAINKYGSGVIKASPTELTLSQALSNPGSYSSTTLGQSLITISGSLYVDYSSMWFDNNWKLETDYGARS